MKKSNKGFFLAETIVVLALVTTTMAFVYPNISKLYNNYSSRINYYDQTQDILLLKEIYNAYKDKIDNETKGQCGDVGNFVGAKKFTGGELKSDNTDDSDGGNGGIRLFDNANPASNFNKIGIINSDFNDYGLVRLYLTGYMTKLSAEDYNFNRYLKRLRKVTNDIHAYRLIGVFYSGGQFRFASIKITTDTFCGIN